MPSLRKVDWAYTLRSTAREFGEDGLTDLAAALTYYAVLSLFPALVALVAILSLFGQSGDAVTSLVEQLSGMGVIPASAVEALGPAIEAVTSAPAPGLGLLIGLVTALWSASNYIKAFGRAMNRIYEVPEGPGAIKLNLQMYALTAVLLVLAALVLVGLAISGPITDALGDLLGLAGAARVAWDYGKIPVLVVVVVVMIALLYNLTPNARQPRMRWISLGAVAAIVIAAVVSVGFGLYLSFQGNNSYTKTYGALAGVIVFLFWLWLVNLALLFGAELDAELERSRELRAGIAAEEQIQLPARDTRQAEKAEAKASEQIEQGREIRRAAARDDEVADGADAEQIHGGPEGTSGPASGGRLH